MDMAAAREVMGLLHDVRDTELRAFAVEALRRWRRSAVANAKKGTPPTDPLVRPSDDQFQTSHLAQQILPLLAQRKSYVKEVRGLEGVLCDGDDAMQREWARGFADLLWWLEHSGLAVAIQRQSGWPTTFRLTSRGVRLLEEKDDNPLLPGFLDRIRARCPGLPEGVVSLLIDARACLDQSVLRAAVVLMGVAYEIAIGEVVDQLHPKGVLDKKLPDRPPAEKIKGVLAAIRDNKIPWLVAIQDRHEAEAAKRAAENAYVFADELRMRRNDASHLLPLHDFDHGGETEEYIVSAGRNLPGLWSVGREP